MSELIIGSSLSGTFTHLRNSEERRDIINYIDKNEVLKYLEENSIINLALVQEQIEMKKNKEFLAQHPYKIWLGSDGSWHTYLPDDTKGRLHIKRKNENDLKKLVIKYWKEKEENPTLEEVFNEWNDRRLDLKKISPSTHLRNKQHFKRHFKEFGKRRIRSVGEDEIGDFLEEQISKYELSAKAFANLKGVTKGFLKRAKKRKLISYNVTDLFNELDTSDAIFKKTIKEDYEEVFSEEEMPIIMKYLTEHLDAKNIGILLMFVTGIRVGELVALKHEVIEGNAIKIRRTETRYFDENGKYVYEVKEFPKTSAGVRTVIIPKDYQWLCGMLRGLNPFGEYVFLNNKGKRMTTNCIRRRLERICIELNIYKKSPHKIRKTYGTILLDNSVDRKLIMGQMGHTDILCTENHYHRNRKNVERKAEVLSAIPDFIVS